MKEYKNNEELIDYLISKNIIINNRELALNNMEKYSYYSIINGYNVGCFFISIIKMFSFLKGGHFYV